MQQERQHQVRKTVGMSLRNDGEIGPVRTQSHCGDDIRGIGGQLFRGERHHARRAGGGGSGFEVNTRRGRKRNRRRRLVRFQRTNNGMRLPRAEHGQHKFSGVSLRINDCIWPDGKVFRGARQFGESPLPARSKLAQRKVVPALLCDFAPAFVKHRLLVTQGRLLSKHDFCG